MHINLQEPSESNRFINARTAKPNLPDLKGDDEEERLNHLRG